MNIAVDIGNTCIKCNILLPSGKSEVHALYIPLREGIFGELTEGFPEPITWRIAQTGSFPWQEIKADVLKVRPRDKFKIVTRQHIPLKIDVDTPQKVGIDRLLAAFAATEQYGDLPMLVVDAGSAITVDVVQDRTFCGGAILPGLFAHLATYPKISKKLPFLTIADLFAETKPVYPGRNTKDAIRNGIYWSTIGAIRQFYEMFFPKEKNVLLILTGGDAEYLLSGLSRVTPEERIKHHVALVLEGIDRCFDE